MHSGGASLAYADVVPSITRTTNRCSSDSSEVEEVIDSSESECVSSVGKDSDAHGLSCVRSQLQKRGISKNASSVIMASWRSGTKKQYDTFHKRWFQFCNERKIDSFFPVVEDVVEFLNIQFEDGLGYSAINTARSALSSLGIIINGFSVGSHPLIIRFLGHRSQRLQ